MKKRNITTTTLRNKKTNGEKIVMVTAYDATFAKIFDDAGVDILLIGDSLGMVIQGFTNTLPVTLDHTIYHTAAVARASCSAHIVADMPFMSYQVSPAQALVSAGRLLQEGGAHAVKLEGGSHVTPQIEKLVSAGIPVMGHIGLTPQSVHQLGGFKTQGRDMVSADRLRHDAEALARAGCYALVVESIPADLAASITSRIAIPTIGIGAGPHCDGQVLVSYDLLGMNPGFKPRFLKTYANLHAHITTAIQSFAEEVRNGSFPSAEHSVKSSNHLTDDLAADATSCTQLYSGAR